MQPSNFKLSITAVGKDALDKAIKIAFDGHPFATHFTQTKGGMRLFWGPQSGSSLLPFALDADDAVAFLSMWLKRLPADVYGVEPDMDGTCRREAWQLSTTADDYSILTLLPQWAEYHK